MAIRRDTMQENVFKPTRAAVFQNVLTAVTEPTVVAPSAATVRALVSVLRELDREGDGVSNRLLSTEVAFNDARGDFLVASAAADLVASDRLELRTTDEFALPVVVATEAVVALLPMGTRVAGLGTDDESFVATATEHVEDLWTAAEVGTLHTPARSRVRETLEAEFGPDVAADFDAGLDALETARTSEAGVGEVTLGLLVAAKHEEQIYEISKWGDDIGLASEAAFSLTKNQLEEEGLIESEKTYRERGRPRHRLLLADDRLRDADAADLATTTQKLLTNTG